MRHYLVCFSLAFFDYRLPSSLAGQLQEDKNFHLFLFLSVSPAPRSVPGT